MPPSVTPLVVPQLIRTKLLGPPPRPEHVVRPRLLARLDLALARPLSVLAAPTGFGKTTLLSAWLDRRGETHAPPAAWLTLDEHDNDPARFAAYFVAALQTLEYNFQLPSPVTAATLEAGLLAMINLVADLPDDVAVILDDVHAITNPAIIQALAAFIQRLPAQLHLILATRTDPAGLPLGQLRARGHLLEIRAPELRFTAAEAHAFLTRTLALPVSEAAAAEWSAQVEGWPAGLQLAALAAGAGEQPAAAFSGGHRYVMDYLAEQVLHQQPVDVQHFLLETAILERLTGPLCDEVLGPGPAGRPPAAARLEALERANLFLEPLDGQRHWYRYQRLFADFLRARLRHWAPDRLAELHRRAAEWHERHGYLPEAVGHALAAGDAEAAARLVEQIAEASWRQGDFMRLLQWLEALPDALIRGRPRLALFHAWILNILGEAEATEQRLREAAAALEAAPEAATERGMLAATHAIVRLMAGDTAGALALTDQALAALPADNHVWRCVVARNIGNAYWLNGDADRAEQALVEAFTLAQTADNVYMALVAMYELGELLLVRGQLRRAAAIFRQALELAAARGAPGLTMPGAVHAGLSAVLREWNDLDGARQHARTGLALGQQGRSLGVQVCAQTRLGLIEQARGDLEAARLAFERAGELAPAALQRRTSFLAHHDVQAQLWGRRGDAPAAAAFFKAWDLDARTPLTYWNEAGLLALARWQLSERRPADAAALVQRLRPAAEAAGRLGRVIEMRVLEALAEHALGHTALALAALEAALLLAEPEGYGRIFLDEGEPLRDLLTAGRTRFRTDAARAYGAHVLAAFSPPPQAAAAAERLSERELEVLRLIAAGLSTPAIAQRLVVAPSTVQTHLKHLYDKLDAHSRTQAVARAREQGLLP